jgi:NADH:ubiquinone reductase (H+-translocating)
VADALIPCKTVIWAAGVAASPLGRMLADSCACALDRAGRVVVQADLSVAAAPNVYAIGDMAAASSHFKGKITAVPGVSPAAKQMGRRAAQNILLAMRALPGEPFHYADYGNLATIGRNAAVVDLATPMGNLRFGGKLAWLFWLFAHIYFLIGFRNRAVVLLDWASAYLSFARHARVVVESATKVPR